jgi:dipeptidyl-peptidase-3
MSREALKKLASVTTQSAALYEEIADAMVDVPPYSLGFPSGKTQSAYYPGEHPMSSEDVRMVSQILEKNGIYPENTRIQKVKNGDHCIFEVLQASIDLCTSPREFIIPASKSVIRLVSGDHCEELTRVCESLREAKKFAANEIQVKFLSQYVESFETGSLNAYRDSQRTWVRDISPRVENIFGFVEPYRDPNGTRAEFEGLVAISEPEETKVLKTLVENSATFIRRLPWAEGATENNGKGLFEKALFEPPDFTSIHSKSDVRTYTKTIADL